MTYERAPAKIGAEDMAICATFQKKKIGDEELPQQLYENFKWSSGYREPNFKTNEIKKYIFLHCQKF